MPSLQNFPRIPVDLPETAILKRLGYNRHLTAIPAGQGRQIRGWMEEAFARCSLSGRAVVLAVRARGADWVELEDGTRWVSAKLAAALAPFARVAVFAVTAGAGPLELTAAALAANNGAAALVYDATASETVEAAAEWLDQFICRQQRAVCAGHFRFSPGYFDWALSAQHDFMRLLDLSSLGITLSPQCQLAPEKTVTAAKGV